MNTCQERQKIPAAQQPKEYSPWTLACKLVNFKNIYYEFINILYF